MGGPDPASSKATANEGAGKKITLEHAKGRESRSDKLEKTGNPAPSGLVAADLPSALASLEAKLDALAAANSVRDPASSYMRSIEVQTELVKVGGAIRKPAPAMVDRLKEVKERTTQLLAKAFHPTQAAVSEVTSPRRDKPIWRAEAEKWGAPRAIKLPPLGLAPGGPPGVRPDSPLIPQVPPHEKSFLEKGLETLKQSTKPPKAPAGPEIPKGHVTPGVDSKAKGTTTITSPPIPFDETSLFDRKAKSESDVISLPKPQEAPKAKPIDPFQRKEDLLDYLDFIPHVLLYNIYRDWKMQRARAAAIEAAKPPKPAEPPNPMIEFLKKAFLTPHAPVPTPPPALADEKVAPPAVQEEPAGPHLEPIDPSCATSYPEDQAARTQCETASQWRQPMPEGGGSPRI